MKRRFFYYMKPAKVTVKDLDQQHGILTGLPSYCAPICRHIDDGDHRLTKLCFDNSATSFRLWNFLLTEEKRLQQARKEGKYIVGTMKDLGTIPVMVYAIPETIAFYPDGAWWIPCLMELSAGLLTEADKMGIDESFCPVRAMLGAFITENHFPIPDLLICSSGAVCDDFSAIAQGLEDMGHPIEWWEMPQIRPPNQEEATVKLLDGTRAPSIQMEYLIEEFARLRQLLEEKTGKKITDNMLVAGIRKSNNIRSLVGKLRELVFSGKGILLPALELLIAEMLALHYCSDIKETENILEHLIEEVQQRKKLKTYIGTGTETKVFWVNPVADLRVMNVLEDCGCRLCGTDFMFTHALDRIPEDIPPLNGLALAAMSDPMTSSSEQRAKRICHDIEMFGAEAVIISKIPGASHCAFEGKIIGKKIKAKGVPVIEIEVPPMADVVILNIKTKIEALREMVN